MGNHKSEDNIGRKKKSDKAKITRQKMGPYSTRSARIKSEQCEPCEQREPCRLLNLKLSLFNQTS